jgi:hypothetical protein
MTWRTMCRMTKDARRDRLMARQRDIVAARQQFARVNAPACRGRASPEHELRRAASPARPRD